MSDKIIDLNLYRGKVNSKDKKSPRDLVLETSDIVLRSLLEITQDTGYDITDDEFIKDMQIIHLLFDATLNRLSGLEDANTEILDNCKNR